MQQTMTAREYQDQFVKTAEEPENPYDRSFQEQHRTKPSKKPAGLPEPTEHQIQTDILERLGLLPKAFFWRENSGLMVSEYKGNKRMWRAGIAGIPDIMGVWQGFAIGIEVKRPGKKQSQEQVAFMSRYRECGGIYIVCSKAADVIEQLKAEMSMWPRK